MLTGNILALLGRGEAMAPHHQQSWERSIAMHGDTTFVEVMTKAPAVYDWYSQDFYQKLFHGLG
jgi:hypothetical protein